MDFCQRKWPLIIAVASSLFLHCAQSLGGGTNSGNALVGRMVAPGETAPASYTVSLYRSDAVPPAPPARDTGFLQRTTSDSAGFYCFQNVKAGTYNVVCRDFTKAIAAFIQDIMVSATSDTTDAGVDTLRAMTSLSGSVLFAPQGYVFLCYVAGSPFCTVSDSTSADSTGYFVLDNIPSKSLFAIHFLTLKPAAGKNCGYPFSTPGEGLPEKPTFVPVKLPCFN